MKKNKDETVPINDQSTEFQKLVNLIKQIEELKRTEVTNHNHLVLIFWKNSLTDITLQNSFAQICI